MSDVCCEAFRVAHEAGSDAEGYGSLMREGDFQSGVELPALRYCPWCGHAVGGDVGGSPGEGGGRDE